MKDQVSAQAICTAYMFGAASLSGGVYFLTKSAGHGLVAFGIMMVVMVVGLLISKAQL